MLQSGDQRHNLTKNLYNLRNVMRVEEMMKWSLDVLVSTIWTRESWMQSKLGNILFVMVSFQVIQYGHGTVN